MGRQGPRLVPFLEDGIVNKKYRNLIPEDPSGLKFSILLPHKSRKLHIEDQFIFRDWYALNGKKYVFNSKHYTDAKQAITASLRKSDYVEKVYINEDKLTYRILSDEEVKEKKRLKKELRKLKEVKQEISDCEDAASSEESGYGSGVDESPLNPEGSFNDNLTIPSDNLSALFDMLQGNCFIEVNDEAAITLNSSGILDVPLKPEPMEVTTADENSLALSDTCISLEPDLFTNLQPLLDSSNSAAYFPDNSVLPTHALDSMEFSSEASESFNSSVTAPLTFENENNIQQLPGWRDEDLMNLLFTDVSASDSSSAMFSKEDNKVTENQDAENVLIDKLSSLIEDIPDLDSSLSGALEEKNQEQMSSPDAGLNDPITEVQEKIYLCKKCVHLGKTPILLCEPQFEKKSSGAIGLLKIIYGDAVLKEINGFEFMEYKFINDDLMVIMKPKDD